MNDEILAMNIAVLGGGWSDEREISLDSARACQKALQEAGFNRVDLINPADEGVTEQLIHGNYGAAFVAMHGRYGEDGCIQGLLEMLNIPYTFSGVLASALGTEKDVAKIMYRAAGIPSPRGVNIASSETLSEADAEEIVNELGLPLFVKPARNGSSYGVTRVTDKAQLVKAFEDAAGCAGEGAVLIEEGIEGTEVTCPVIGNNDPQALPVIEVVTGADFYNLQVKYEPSELHHVIPARLPEDTYALVQSYAVAAHKALGCAGVSRSDFIVTPDGLPVILETNTIPGMTETSLLPDSARHIGIEFPQLCRMFIEFALEAHPKAR